MNAAAAAAQTLPCALWVPGTMPTINELIHDKAHGFTKSSGKRVDGYQEAKKEWTNTIGYLALQQGFRAPILEPVAVTFVHYARDRKRDRDGAAFVASKFALDAMVKMKVLQSDGWNYVVDLRHYHQVGTPPGKHAHGVVLIFDREIWTLERAKLARIA